MAEQLSMQQVLLDKVLEIEKDKAEVVLPEDEAFERFVSELAVKHAQPSNERVVASVLDCGADGGIDAAWLLVDELIVDEGDEPTSLRRGADVTIVLIQSTRSRSFTEDRMRKIANTLSDLLPHTPRNTATYDERLVAFFDRFRNLVIENAAQSPRIRFRVIYATRASQISDGVRNLTARVDQAITTNFPAATLDMEFWDAAQIKVIYDTPIITTLPLQVTRYIQSPAGGWVCLATISDFNKFLRDEKGNLRVGLFDENVRDYNPEWGVNEKIEETLKGAAPPDFWWLNNGITILADSVQMGTSEIMTLNDPRIVNGLQTSHEIAKYFDTATDSDARLVLVRAIEATDPETRDRVILATNSQTPIPPGALLATTPIQRAIETILQSRGLYYERRGNQHRDKARDRVVSINYAAQSILSLLLERPNDARARVGSILKQEAREQPDEPVFSGRYPIEMYSNAVEVMRAIDRFLSSQALTRNQRTNYRFYLAYLVSASLAKGRRQTPEGLKSIPLEALTEEFLKGRLDILKGAFDKLMESGAGLDSIAKGDKVVAVLRGLIEKAPL